MSKVNDLIKELCPNGVKYKKIAEVCEKIYAGGTPSTTHEKYYNGNIKWLRSGEINFNELYDTEMKITEVGLNNSSAKIIPSHSVVIAMTGATVARTAMVMEDMSMNQSVCALVPNNEINYRFLYQVLTNKYFELKQSGQGVLTSLNLDRIKKIVIPVPPIEVQEEIARILDKFGELESELESELEARKSQYEFWRGKLLENSKEKVKFGDVATIVRGGSPRPIKDFITDDDNGIPWIKIGDTNPNDKYVFDTKEKINVDGSKKSRFVKAGDFILSNSMSFGRPYILKIDGCIHDGWLSISNFEDTYMPDFLYHLLSSKPIQDTMAMKASIGTVKNLNADIVKSIELPLYTKVEQEKIVRILDKFEELTNDISLGLPAEIELRRQQYEYYRNKLLSFDELSIN